jgi:hypothetical protein
VAGNIRIDFVLPLSSPLPRISGCYYCVQRNIQPFTAKTLLKNKFNGRITGSMLLAWCWGCFMVCFNFHSVHFKWTQRHADTFMDFWNWCCCQPLLRTCFVLELPSFAVPPSLCYLVLAAGSSMRQGVSVRSNETHQRHSAVFTWPRMWHHYRRRRLLSITLVPRKYVRDQLSLEVWAPQAESIPGIGSGGPGSLALRFHTQPVGVWNFGTWSGLLWMEWVVSAWAACSDGTQVHAIL